MMTNKLHTFALSAENLVRANLGESGVHIDARLPSRVSRVVNKE
jgi:hypothetical protein